MRRPKDRPPDNSPGMKLYLNEACFPASTILFGVVIENCKPEGKNELFETNENKAAYASSAITCLQTHKSVLCNLKRWHLEKSSKDHLHFG